MKYTLDIDDKSPLYTSLEKGREKLLIHPITVHRIAGLQTWDASFDPFQRRLKSLHDNTCDSSIHRLSKIKPKCCPPTNINHGFIQVVNNCQDMSAHNTNPLKKFTAATHTTIYFKFHKPKSDNLRTANGNCYWTQFNFFGHHIIIKLADALDKIIVFRVTWALHNPYAILVEY
jgi:hypothetical protein